MGTQRVSCGKLIGMVEFHFRMPLEKEVMKLLKFVRKSINQSCVTAFSLEE